MSNFYIREIKFTSLLKLFDRKIFAVPELQREFVWNAKKACSLLDSIYKNYPIGTAMVWETSSRYGFQLRHRLHVLPQFAAETNKQIYFIIDGQQRLSVLYHITTGITVTNSFGKQINFHNIYFNTDNSEGMHFHYFPRRPPSEDYYSIPDILSSRYKHRFRSLGVRKRNAIQECREKILGYHFPIIFVKGDQIADIRETFIRINSQGTPISAADRAFARAENINLRHHLYEVRHGFENGFSEIDYDTLFMALLLIYGETQLGERARNRIVKKLEEGDDDIKDFSSEWRRIRLSFNKTITYLINDLHIINMQYLPSKNIISLLTLFFYHNKNKRPDSNQKRQIHKWFWYSSLSQRYSGRGYSRNILSDAVFFRRLGASRRGRFPIEELAIPQ